MFCRKCVQCINISRPEAKNMDISLIGWSHLGLWIVKNIKQPWHIPLEYRIFKIEWRILLISYLFLINLFCVPFSFGISDVQNRMRYITPNIFLCQGRRLSLLGGVPLHLQWQYWYRLPGEKKFWNHIHKQQNIEDKTDYQVKRKSLI